MITSLEGVVQFTKALGDELPAHRSRIVILPPGMNTRQIERLKGMLPNMPANYLTCVQTIDVYRKVLGYFSLWPEGWDDSEGDLGASLAASNLSDENPYLQLMETHNLYHIGSFESSPLFVSTKAANCGHVVIILDPEEPELLELADSFQEFLVCAANLAQINANDDDGERGRAMKEFHRRLDLIAIPEAQRDVWLQLASMALG